MKKLMSLVAMLWFLAAMFGFNGQTEQVAGLPIVASQNAPVGLNSPIPTESFAHDAIVSTRHFFRENYGHAKRQTKLFIREVKDAFGELTND